MNQFKNRSDIPQCDRWALEDLYPSREDWQKELESLEEDRVYMASFEGRLASDAAALYDYMTALEKLELKASRLGNYCTRLADEDTRNTEGQAMSGSFMSKIVAVNAACSYAAPEIMSIEDDRMEAFYSQCPDLERYRRYLSDLRRRKAHTLSAAEERLLAAAGEMSQTPVTVSSTMLDADTVFPDAVGSDGQKHPLSSATYVMLQQSADRELRRSSYENLYDTLGGFRNTHAALLDGQNKKLKFYADARRYGSALDASLDGNNVPIQVYHSLIEAVHQNLPKLHRYIRLRKKLLNVDELHFYDIYTPLLSDVDKKISYEQAKQTVYDAMAPLGEEYRALLKEGFENRWIDVYPNPGKRAGAYSADTPVHPYVLLNFNGTLSDQFTLAHEMGHALHSCFSDRNQNPLDSQYEIFVAEVASTCNEALLMQYLLGKTTDRKERAYLINYFLEQFKGTIYRQTLFAEFELKVAQIVGEGGTLTEDLLCSIYRELNETYYGPDIVTDDRIAMEWARIPHFYYDFYVFQYATGYAAAIALSRRILAEGETAVRDYLGFLSGGCSKSPIDLLKGAGVDMTGPEPINQALKLFEELLDEMEALTSEEPNE